MLVNLLLVIQIIICVAMVGVILLQRSEGGALGMGGGGSGGFMTARGAGNLLTTITMWLAAGFFAVSIFLTILGNIDRGAGSLSDQVAPGRTDPGALPPATPAPAGAARPEAPPTAPATTSLDSLAAPLPADSPAQPAPAPAQPAPAAKK